MKRLEQVFANFQLILAGIKTQTLLRLLEWAHIAPHLSGFFAVRTTFSTVAAVGLQRGVKAHLIEASCNSLALDDETFCKLEPNSKN